jgi:hypothetical protein
VSPARTFLVALIVFTLVLGLELGCIVALALLNRKIKGRGTFASTLKSTSEKWSPVKTRQFLVSMNISRKLKALNNAAKSLSMSSKYSHMMYSERK